MSHSGDPCAAVTATVDPPLLDLMAEAAEPTPDIVVCVGRHRRTVLRSLPVFPPWALVCAGVLETPIWWGEMTRPLALFAVLSKPIDVLFVLVVLVLLWCVIGRLWLSMGLLLGLTVGLSAVNVAKMSILVDPLYPSDYQFLNSPGFLLEMVTPRAVVSAPAGLPVLAVGTVLLSRVWAGATRATSGRPPARLGLLVGTRIVGTVVCVALLASALQFNDPGNPWRRLYEAQERNGSRSRRPRTTAPTASWEARFTICPLCRCRFPRATAPGRWPRSHSDMHLEPRAATPGAIRAL